MQFKIKNPFRHEKTAEEEIIEGVVLSRAMLECNGYDPENPLCRDINGCMKCPKTVTVRQAYAKGL